MASNYTQRPFGLELALRLLKDWIQNEFPIKNVEYRGKVFSFHTDLPNQHMEELADAKAEGMDKVRIMIRLLSIVPNITQEDLDIMPSSMLMALWTGLFPKKAADDFTESDYRKYFLCSILNQPRSEVGRWGVLETERMIQLHTSIRTPKKEIPQDTIIFDQAAAKELLGL